MGHEKDCCKENRKNWMRERNALEGGSEADSCLIQSILISKKSLKNVIQTL